MWMQTEFNQQGLMGSRESGEVMVRLWMDAARSGGGWKLAIDLTELKVFTYGLLMVIFWRKN